MKRLKKAFFLDRDGVLVKEQGYILKSEEMQIFDFAYGCVNEIHKKGYLAIVITNQSGIARGLFSEDTLITMNDRLREETGVDEIYYCPHHPDGIVAKYAIACNCRKPDIGLIIRAQREFEIDLEKSFMVGDRASDILVGQNAGMKTVLLNSGYGEKRLEMKVEPTYIFEDLRGILGVI